MSNMSYCRFENTYNDLVDCYHALNSEEGEDKNLSKDEKIHKDKLIKLANKIARDHAEDYGD